MTVTVTDGRETHEVVRGVDGEGVEHKEQILYRDLVARRSLAGQVMSGGGTAIVWAGEPQKVWGGFLLKSADDADRPVWWAAEERADGGLGLWVWTTTDGEAHWDVPEGWAGEAPIATSMPWLRVSR